MRLTSYSDHSASTVDGQLQVNQLIIQPAHEIDGQLQVNQLIIQPAHEIDGQLQVNQFSQHMRLTDSYKSTS